jgi:hypothetical protein
VLNKATCLRRSTEIHALVLGETDLLSIELSTSIFRTNGRCNIRNAMSLAHRLLRNEDAVDGLLAGALPTGAA